MSFFESIPQPPPPEPVRRRRPAWERSDAVIPASVPGDVVLLRTEQVAVAIGSIRAYPNGFEFALHVRLRGQDHGEPFAADPLGWHGTRHGQRQSEDILRLGVMYADGRRAATTGGRCRPDDDPGQLILRHGGGGGNDLTWDGDFWVYPLPPDGPVTFVVSWLDHGIVETRSELDGAAIREAAQRAVTLWPDDSEPDTGVATSTITASAFCPACLASVQLSRFAHLRLPSARRNKPCPAHHRGSLVPAGGR